MITSIFGLSQTVIVSAGLNSRDSQKNHLLLSFIIERKGSMSMNNTLSKNA